MTRRAMLVSIGVLALRRAGWCEEVSFKLTNNCGAEIPQLFLTRSEEDEQMGEPEDILRGVALAAGTSREVQVRTRRPLKRCDFSLRIGSKADWFNIDVSHAEEIILLPKGRFQVRN